MKKITFITGTDTAVGKTLLTAHLLHYLRKQDSHTLATKPFCSGGLDDVHLLQSLQPGELTNAEMNPFYFAKPVAPLAATKSTDKKLTLRDVLKPIKHLENKCEHLLIEGSGGLLVPLGNKFTVADLIAALDCTVIVIARNQLGTINHTLLTINALQSIGIKPTNLKIVLTTPATPDESTPTNPKIIAQFLPKIPIFTFPYLGTDAATTQSVLTNASKAKKILQKLVR